MKNTLTRTLALVTLMLFAAVAGFGQTATSSLANLPEAETLVYINTQRILNEAVPRLMPEKDVAGMRSAFEMAKQQSGIDPSKIEYVVIASRFKRPTPDLNFQAAEFMVVISGDMSAESLMTLARMASGGKLRDEKYGSKTLAIMTIDEVAKMAESMPMLKSLSQVGIVALNATTIAAGSPAYLRAAIDAGDGKGRIAPESLNSLLRDPNVLISVAGSPWGAFAKSFGMLGTEGNARPARCESRLGDFYGALTMDAVNFRLRGMMNADNPDTAKIINNLLSGLLQQGLSAIPDKSVQAMLKGVTLTPENDEVVLQADFPQQMVVDMIRQQIMPKKQETPIAQPVTKPSKAPVKRRTRRRG
ncbi:MAG: hypothetical protein QOE77_1187 [Blastocatellia bacterium]|jgi:hypothetical protein|nr:hypothetical protein [Blastocatellia bacterium]